MSVGPATTKSFAILGAGITGLSAAHRLARLGHRVRVFESSPRTGGAIRTEHTPEGWLIEAGPNSLLAGDPALDALFAELGLTSSIIPAAPAAKHRYIVRRGRPVPLPLSPPALLTSPLLSLRAKFNVLSELLTSPKIRTTDLSLAELIHSHFGREVVDYLLNPFVSGVYAGNPQKLSARYAFPQLWELERKHGSLLRGLAATRKKKKTPSRIISFTGGLQTLPDSLAASLPPGTIALEAQTEALVPGEKWSVVWRDAAGGAHTETFDGVITALPAAALAQLRFNTLGERPLAALATMEHPPVTSLFLGYRREQVAHPLDGFGMLLPAVELRTTLGVIFSSTLFPGRAPAGHVALTVMLGGTREPEFARLPPEKLHPAVERDLHELLGVTGQPVFQKVNYWPRAIPQYNLGHERFLEAMTACERAYPRLYLGGQARDGISLPACLAAGEKLALRAST